MVFVSLVVVGFALQSVIVSADSRAVVLFVATIAPLAMAVRLGMRRIAFQEGNTPQP